MKGKTNRLYKFNTTSFLSFFIFLVHFIFFKLQKHGIEPTSIIQISLLRIHLRAFLFFYFVFFDGLYAPTNMLKIPSSLKEY